MSVLAQNTKPRKKSLKKNNQRLPEPSENNDRKYKPNNPLPTRRHLLRHLISNCSANSGTAASTEEEETGVRQEV